MKVYTIQLASWREAEKLGIPLLDVTLKSGDKAFAPSKQLLLDYKNNEITIETYVERYKSEMRYSFKRNRERWREVCEMDCVAIACYCGGANNGDVLSKEGFCHRYILIELLDYACVYFGIQYRAHGEIFSLKSGLINENL